jgi:F0F1-type ATP synthase membrane subunit a
VSQLGCSTRMLVGILVVVLALFLAGLVGGAIGSSLFGIEAPSFMKFPEPHVELPAETVFQLFGFPVTNTLIASWFTIIVLVVIFYAATRKMRLIPGRLQCLVEAGIELLLNFTEGVAGKENGRRFFPVIATIFLFVIFNAYLALLPLFGPGIVRTEQAEAKAPVAGVVASVEVEEGDRVEEGEIIYLLESGEEITAPINGEVEHLLSVGDSVAANDAVASIENRWPLFRSANTDLNMPLAFALVSFVFVEYWGMRVLGATRYLTTVFFNFGLLLQSLKQLLRGKVRSALGGLMTGVINAFVGILELFSHFVRIISFTFRLFGNMTAGEILLLIAAFLIPWVMPVPFYGLEILIGFVQALIFAGLTLVFATVAVAPHGEEHE